MRRADRLFQIVHKLRRNRVLTASRLAAELEVSERTIYRDLRVLSSSGLQIEGEAGVGYRLRDWDLPPLMFDREEIEALVFGVRIVRSWADPDLAEAAQRVLSKVEAVLPDEREADLRETALFAPRLVPGPPIAENLVRLRGAIRERRKVRFAYFDAQGEGSERVVWPLGMVFYGPTWNVASWCELRLAFRAFRPDRMRRLEVLGEHFEATAGRTMDDYLKLVGCDERGHLS